MEVKIGVQRTPREIVLESTQSPDEVEAAVRDALRTRAVCSLWSTRRAAAWPSRAT